MANETAPKRYIKSKRAAIMIRVIRAQIQTSSRNIQVKHKTRGADRRSSRIGQLNDIFRNTARMATGAGILFAYNTIARTRAISGYVVDCGCGRHFACSLRDFKSYAVVLDFSLRKIHMFYWSRFRQNVHYVTPN